MLKGEMSYMEAEKKSLELKAVARVKEAMCSEMELDTWEEVESTIPEFAKVDVLKTFQLQNKKKPPKDFLVSVATLCIVIDDVDSQIASAHVSIMSRLQCMQFAII